MKRFIAVFTISLLFISNAALHATHLFGGYFRYEFISSTSTTETYKLTLTVFRDCRADGDLNKKIPLDPTILICVYNQIDSVVNRINLDLTNSAYVNPEKPDSCGSAMYQCVEAGTYSTNITLSKAFGVYTFYWDRCCRGFVNNLLQNAGSPEQGATWKCVIALDGRKNSNPVFSQTPYAMICFGDSANWHLNATDPDGDSLSFEQVHLWQGASVQNPIYSTCPNKHGNPVKVDYNNSFSADYLFGTDGISQTDAITGDILLKSFKVGYFSGSTEVTEWRNGVAINKSRLDYTILVEYPLSAKTFEKPNIMLFPNPVSETLNVIGLRDENLNWEVLDIRGAKVIGGNAKGDFIMETNNILNGLYILRITNGTEISNLKFAVQHQ
ncbi:MAG: T9SS type A sorting domain-containing protein [Bacteroidetes bacterium]|nr:T9SS type A sorting domain-containing protein [Bacteroidota bacterium]